ncbi:MAG: hypothetical protein SCH71_10660 [Desulfobulbaceae bacterium]|nr:hypothetical protein [Desulfobulbaceae bacterium]
MKFILSLHPGMQLIAILLAYYAGYLGLQRARSLHFGRQVVFPRKRHALTGAIALLVLLGGFFGGFITASLFLQGHAHDGTDLHKSVALIILPLLVLGLATGYYIYKHPGKQRIFSIIHGLNNLSILILALLQIYSGWHKYQAHVLGG